jgi:hypothetical protein
MTTLTATGEMTTTTRDKVRLVDILAAAGVVLWYLIIGTLFVLGIATWWVLKITWWLLVASVYVFGYLIVGMLICCFFLIAFPFMIAARW